MLNNYSTVWVSLPGSLHHARFLVYLIRLYHVAQRVSHEKLGKESLTNVISDSISFTLPSMSKSTLLDFFLRDWRAA